MSGVVIVQHIVTTWTKQSRGGAKAVRRNRVPQEMAVPLHGVERRNLTLLQHNVQYWESDDFTTPREKTIVNAALRPIVYECVRVDTEPEGVQATFQYTRAGGMPDRGWAYKE